jgi:UDP-GlcNAc:undecaprenyl-phosphate/decaprenyl-phosphate GlcNAc-1-phosphate transferase
MINELNIILFFQIIINIFFLINFTKIASYVNIYDLPSRRKIHTNPVPPIGGILFFINFIYIFCVSKISSIQVFYFNDFFLISSSLIFILGLVDDKKDLNPFLKFLILISLVVFHLILQNDYLINKFYLDFINFDVHLTYYQSFFFTTLCVLLFINACNLYDGINLQYSLYIFIFFSYLILKNNDLEILKLLYLPLIFFIYLNF